MAAWGLQRSLNDHVDGAVVPTLADDSSAFRNSNSQAEQRIDRAGVDVREANVLQHRAIVIGIVAHDLV
jgi:hypothetical protein